MATDATPTNQYIEHAAGFVDNEGPKIVTSRFGHEDSFTIDRYEATGGYQALRKALDHTPAQVHEEVRDAILLGRGGAGFPAGIKWGFLPPEKHPYYLVVNGDESEPGTYKDRLLLERDPHQLIEGCLITCYALGLQQCFLYVRGEMALAQERIAAALNEAYAAVTRGATSWALSFLLMSCSPGERGPTSSARRRRSSRAWKAIGACPG